MSTYFDHIDTACRVRGTTLTQVLRAIGKSKSSVTAWRTGSAPSIEACDSIASYLGISIDELVKGAPFDDDKRVPPIKPEELPQDEREWLNLYRQIPESKQYAVKTFLLQMIPETAPEVLDHSKGEKSAS